MTNSFIYETALKQSAVDMGCSPDDFLKKENVIVPPSNNPGARRYLKLPLFFDMASYGTNIVASAAPEIAPFVKNYINRPDIYHLFETPSLYELNDELAKYGQRVRFMAEYFLPDINELKAAAKRNAAALPLKVLVQSDFRELYLPEWSNALCSDRKELDVLGVGAYDGDKLVGLAACSADAEEMWQIGIDVLPEYRRHGLAKALVTALALEIISRGKVPFYCAAWSNVKSVRCAVSSGFRPAWVQLSAKKISE